MVPTVKPEFSDSEKMGAQQLKRALIMSSFIIALLTGVALLVGSVVPRGASDAPCWNNTTSVLQYIGPCLRQELPYWLVKALFALPMIWLVEQMTCRINAYNSKARLVADMNTTDGNDSSAILLWGGIIVIGLILARTPMVSLTVAGVLEFVINLVIRFASTMTLCMVTSFASLRRYNNVRSFVQFVKLIQTTGTDSAAITLFGSMVFAAVFAP